jgi:hypothetical protein
VLFVLAFVEKLMQAIRRTDSKMMTAFRADLQVIFYGFAPNDLAAGITFLPKSFRPDALLFIVGRSAFL